MVVVVAIGIAAALTGSELAGANIKFPTTRDRQNRGKNGCRKILTVFRYFQIG